MPTFFFELPAGYFYGFPAFDARGMKVASHGDGPATEGPVSLEGLQDPADEMAVREFLSDHFTFKADTLLSQQACMYTFSPDEHFIMDRDPHHERVVFVAGLSGHGFKFTSVLGEALAELSFDGQSRLDLDFLRLQRFS